MNTIDRQIQCTHHSFTRLQTQSSDGLDHKFFPRLHSQNRQSPKLKGSSMHLPRQRIYIFLTKYISNGTGLNLRNRGALKPHGPQKAKPFARKQKGFYVHHSTDPQSDVARATRLGRHLRSRFRCSMCYAVRMD